MEGGGQHQNGRHRMDYYNMATHPSINMMPQHTMKEQHNALVMGQKVLSILHERDRALEERNAAVAHKMEALAARDEAVREREEAFAERDKALMERDNALAAIKYREDAMKFGGNQRGSKRIPHPQYNSNDMAQALNNEEMHATAEDVKPQQTKRAKSNNAMSVKETKSPRKASKAVDDLIEKDPGDSKKVKTEWDSQDVVIDESVPLPVPVCSCTGMPHQCYKWGSGGWQSSCCTTTMSCHPLPLMPNKRGARIGGRKMSGSVFSKLLSRLASEGYDFLAPVDLRDYWAKHGTNRYITIK